MKVVQAHELISRREPFDMLNISLLYMAPILSYATPPKIPFYFEIGQVLFKFKIMKLKFVMLYRIFGWVKCVLDKGGAQTSSDPDHGT